ncbi:hypothetical protein BLNAU_14904 [Blattamonas nauphoetae]|uniref:Uncharacterized protein n=1 Tax=Blattamonas nauphoetae TaxID=2049346 RepID=A0ABQ9XFI9_9EUKA|nr:hypothetical protein BLNAU_14904 [Blattamonas nauphoetae]
MIFPNTLLQLTFRVRTAIGFGIGVIDSSKLEQYQTSNIADQPESSVFALNSGYVHQNGVFVSYGNKEPNANSVVTMELDMNRHTLVLFVDGQRQPHSLANIPQNVRFALSIHYKDRYADILGFNDISA